MPITMQAVLPTCSVEKEEWMPVFSNSGCGLSQCWWVSIRNMTVGWQVPSIELWLATDKSITLSREGFSYFSVSGLLGGMFERQPLCSEFNIVANLWLLTKICRGLKVYFGFFLKLWRIYQEVMMLVWVSLRDLARIFWMDSDFSKRAYI